jgi:uncharacterized membrane protein YfcA
MFTPEAPAIFAVVLLSSFLQTITGFGYALSAAPLLALIIGPKDAVMFVLFTGIITKLTLLCRIWHHSNFSAIGLLFTASLAGALPGAYVLKIISNDTLKLAIGLVLIIITFAMARDFRVIIHQPRLVQTVVGIISGFLATTTSLSGPPVVMYYLNEHLAKETIRANLTRYFILNNAAALVISYFFGTLNPGLLAANTLICLPAIVLGIGLGEKLFTKFNADIFKKLALAVIAASAIISIFSGLSH